MKQEKKYKIKPDYHRIITLSVAGQYIDRLLSEELGKIIVENPPTQPKKNRVK